MASKFDELEALFYGLHGDVMYFIEEKDKGEFPPILCRSFVRAVFAFIEGVTFATKQYALEENAGAFDAAEQALLLEKEYYVDKKGKAHTRDARISFRNNLRFALGSLLRTCDTEYEPKYDGPGYQSLVAAVKIRDRLMHPKSQSDINVTDEKVDVVMTAYKWFSATFMLCLRSVCVAKARSPGHSEPPKMDEQGRIMLEQAAL